MSPCSHVVASSRTSLKPHWRNTNSISSQHVGPIQGSCHTVASRGCHPLPMPPPRSRSRARETQKSNGIRVRGEAGLEFWSGEINGRLSIYNEQSRLIRRRLSRPSVGMKQAASSQPFYEGASGRFHFIKKNHYGPLCELGRTVIQNIYVLGYVKPNENSWVEFLGWSFMVIYVLGRTFPKNLTEQ
jgi:hypothetical protein